MYRSMKILNKILAGRIEHHCKERTYCDQGKFTQWVQNCSSIRKSINIIHCINTPKGYININIIINANEPLRKFNSHSIQNRNWYLFICFFNKIYIHIILLNRGTPIAFPFRLGKSQDAYYLHLFLNCSTDTGTGGEINQLETQSWKRRCKSILQMLGLRT